MVSSLRSYPQAQTPVGQQPGHGPLHHPAVAVELGRALDAAAGDAGGDAAPAQVGPAAAEVIALVRMQLPRAASGPAALASHGWNRVKQRLEQQAVGGVSRPRAPRPAARPPRRSPGSTSSRPCPGRWGSARSAGPPFRPHRDAVQAAAGPVEQLLAAEPVEHLLVAAGTTPPPAARPAAPPAGHPGSAASSAGRSRHRQPVLSTNRIPSNAARSGTRGRPPGPRAGFGGVISGSTRAHSSSSTSPRGGEELRFGTPPVHPRHTF